MNEEIVAILIGLLLSISAGVRVMVPILTLNLLALYHVIILPRYLEWVGSFSTLLVLLVGTAAEIIIYFIPAVGTFLKGVSTPLAFVAGTLIMAVPLSHQSPLYQWTLALVLGGGSATAMHLGITGLRALTSPAEVLSFGLWSILWNMGEMLLSLIFSLLALAFFFVSALFLAFVGIALILVLVMFSWQLYLKWARLTSSVGREEV